MTGGAADGRSPAHPRERLDRRGMCRGVREPNEVRQTAEGSPEGVSEANQTSAPEQMT